MPKFDYVIQNPPYSKSLHLDFFKKGFTLLSSTGHMYIIEPATWLINVRKNGKAKLYSEIKELVKGHVKSVTIENLNKEFGTALYVPFAITVIDKLNVYDTIDYTVFGENQTVNSIYDCNLIGKYETIWSILDKVQKFGDMMKNHITNTPQSLNYYSLYNELICRNGCSDPRFGDAWFINNHYNSYYISAFEYRELVDIKDELFHKLKSGYTYEYLKCYPEKDKDVRSDKMSNNIYGTKQELENWKYFIFNNKLPLFVNICLTINQNNNSKAYLPWLVGKQYTDDEINKLFNFTQEEINLIDYTLEKFERHSPWFKRYMCGPSSVSDEEVQTFIDNLKKRWFKS